MAGQRVFTNSFDPNIYICIKQKKSSAGNIPGKTFLRVPGMAQVLRVKVPSRVFTAKCSEPQAEDSNV